MGGNQAQSWSMPQVSIPGGLMAAGEIGDNAFSARMNRKRERKENQEIVRARQIEVDARNEERYQTGLAVQAENLSYQRGIDKINQGYAANRESRAVGQDNRAIGQDNRSKEIHGFNVNAHQATQDENERKVKAREAVSELHNSVPNQLTIDINKQYQDTKVPNAAGGYDFIPKTSAEIDALNKLTIAGYDSNPNVFDETTDATSRQARAKKSLMQSDAKMSATEAQTQAEALFPSIGLTETQKEQMKADRAFNKELYTQGMTQIKENQAADDKGFVATSPQPFDIAKLQKEIPVGLEIFGMGDDFGKRDVAKMMVDTMSKRHQSKNQKFDGYLTQNAVTQAMLMSLDANLFGNDTGSEKAYNSALEMMMEQGIESTKKTEKQINTAKKKQVDSFTARGQKITDSNRKVTSKDIMKQMGY